MYLSKAALADRGLEIEETEEGFQVHTLAAGPTKEIIALVGSYRLSDAASDLLMTEVCNATIKAAFLDAM